MQSSLKFNEPQEDIRLNKSRATDETFDGVHFLNFNPLVFIFKKSCQQEY